MSQNTQQSKQHNKYRPYNNDKTNLLLLYFSWWHMFDTPQKPTILKLFAFGLDHGHSQMVAFVTICY
jgi:hypothetical protein